MYVVAIDCNLLRAATQRQRATPRERQQATEERTASNSRALSRTLGTTDVAVAVGAVEGQSNEDDNQPLHVELENGRDGEQRPQQHGNEERAPEDDGLDARDRALALSRRVVLAHQLEGSPGVAMRMAMLSRDVVAAAPWARERESERERERVPPATRRPTRSLRSRAPRSTNASRPTSDR